MDATIVNNGNKENTSESEQNLVNTNELNTSTNNIVVNITGDYDFNINDIREQIKKLPIGNKLIDDELDIIIIQIKNTIESNTKKQHQMAINNFFNELKEHIDENFLKNEMDEYNDINISDSASDIGSLCDIFDLDKKKKKPSDKLKQDGKRNKSDNIIRTKKIRNTEVNINGDEVDEKNGTKNKKTRTKKIINNNIKNPIDSTDIVNETSIIIDVNDKTEKKLTKKTKNIKLNNNDTKKSNDENKIEKKTRRKIIESDVNNELNEINEISEKKNKICDEISNEILKKIKK